MITIIVSSFWSGEQEKIAACKEFLPLVMGKADAIKEVAEDPKDPESSTELYFQFYDLTLDYHDAWSEMADFARENELYVIVYDHETFDRKGYWYDEQDEWILQNFGQNETLEKLVK
jgi:hypothetical protein